MVSVTTLYLSNFRVVIAIYNQDRCMIMFAKILATLTVKLLAEKVLIKLALVILKHLKDKTSNTLDDDLYDTVSEALKD